MDKEKFWTIVAIIVACVLFWASTLALEEKSGSEVVMNTRVGMWDRILIFGEQEVDVVLTSDTEFTVSTRSQAIDAIETDGQLYKIEVTLFPADFKNGKATIKIENSGENIDVSLKTNDAQEITVKIMVAAYTNIAFIVACVILVLTALAWLDIYQLL